LCKGAYAEKDSSDKICDACVDYYKMEDGECVIDKTECDDENCKTCANDHDGDNQLCFECKSGYMKNEDGECEKFNDCKDEQEGCFKCWGEDGKGDCISCTDPTKVPDGKKCVEPEEDDDSEVKACDSDNDNGKNCVACDDKGAGDCVWCDCGYHLDDGKCEKGNVFNSANTVAILAVVALLMILF